MSSQSLSHFLFKACLYRKEMCVVADDVSRGISLCLRGVGVVFVLDSDRETQTLSQARGQRQTWLLSRRRCEHK